jgi:hypothetical protein
MEEKENEKNRRRKKRQEKLLCDLFSDTASVQLIQLAIQTPSIITLSRDNIISSLSFGTLCRIVSNLAEIWTGHIQNSTIKRLQHINLLNKNFWKQKINL